jgi:hypothetical protein
MGSLFLVSVFGVCISLHFFHGLGLSTAVLLWYTRRFLFVWYTHVQKYIYYIHFHEEMIGSTRLF